MPPTEYDESGLEGLGLPLHPAEHSAQQSAEDGALQSAFGKAQNGFQGPISSFVGAQVIDVKFADQWRARPMVVTLASVKAGPIPGAWPQGNPSAQNNTGALATLFGPPDNQVAMALTPIGSGGLQPPEVLAYNIGGLYLQVEWGVGNYRERAFVSYPYGGGSFQLQAAALRVAVPSGLRSLFAGAPVSFPVIGGWVSPGERSQLLQPPTLLTNALDVTDAVPRAFWCPPRARGYRLHTAQDQDAVAPSTVIIAQQLTTSIIGPGVAVRQIDGTNVTAYSGNSNELDVSGPGLGNAWQRATRNLLHFTPLHPQAVGVLVKTVGAQSGDAIIGVEWLLDLG